MKDITLTEAVDRMKGFMGSDRFDIGMEYSVRGNRCIGFEWSIATFKDGCETFTAPTLRSAVEQAEEHRIGPMVAESDLQAQLDN